MSQGVKSLDSLPEASPFDAAPLYEVAASSADRLTAAAVAAGLVSQTVEVPAGATPIATLSGIESTGFNSQ
ncbi:MAG TPA: hypothetical protein VLF91_00410 [Candidatus Saccharimonadales bacterium]|nr:hypothetical protein [Candidatus Saccharimonadales bacterium]